MPRAVTVEVQYMLAGLRIHGGWKVAQQIVKLAECEPGTFRNIGPSGAHLKRPMSQSEAKRIVEMAAARVAAADASDP